MRSFISGIAYRVGEQAAIEVLFNASPEGRAALNFYRARGLRYFRRQVDTAQDMSSACIAEALRKSSTAAAELGAVVVDVDAWCFSGEDRRQIFESLHLSGLTNVPVIGVGLQDCSAAAAALDLADRRVRTDEGHRPVLVLVCGRSGSSGSRIDDARKTILSDGVAACVVTAKPGDFQLLSAVTSTDLAVARENEQGGEQSVSLVNNYSNVAAVASKVCGLAGVSSEDIDQLFCTNGSSIYINLAAEAAGVDIARVYSDDVANLGHVFSCDNFISLATYAEHHRFRPNGKYMLIGWSAYVISGAVLVYCGNRDGNG